MLLFFFGGGSGEDDILCARYQPLTISYCSFSKNYFELLRLSERNAFLIHDRTNRETDLKDAKKNNKLKVT